MDQAAVDAQLKRLEDEQDSLEKILSSFENEVEKIQSDPTRGFTQKTSADAEREKAYVLRISRLDLSLMAGTITRNTSTRS